MGRRSRAGVVGVLRGWHADLAPPTDLGAVLDAIATEFGLVDDAEVTCEANPETITPELLVGSWLLASPDCPWGCRVPMRGPGGVGPGAQPGGAVRAARLAQLAGFHRVSLDLIYGTPGRRSTRGVGPSGLPLSLG